MTLRDDLMLKRCEEMQRDAQKHSRSFRFGSDTEVDFKLWRQWIKFWSINLNFEQPHSKTHRAIVSMISSVRWALRLYNNAEVYSSGVWDVVWSNCEDLCEMLVEQKSAERQGRLRSILLAIPADEFDGLIERLEREAYS